MISFKKTTNPNVSPIGKRFGFECFGTPEYRRNGIASALLEKALAELDRSKDITVTTFRDNDKKGIAPRALYKQFGFAEEKLLIENDYPVQRFVLRGSL